MLKTKNDRDLKVHEKKDAIDNRQDAYQQFEVVN